jgi:hypothetical protein
MSSETDFEGMVAWRFQQRNLGPGTRIESTIFVGGAVPLQALRHDGMRAAPSFHVAASTGYISRSHYFWLNGGYHASAARGTDQMGDTGTVSVVYGYRPGFLRLDYPKPDLRFFVEGVAERSGVSQHHGFDVVPTGGNAIFVGPTALLLYKAYGIEGGVLFPVYDSNIYRVQEMRVAINFSYSFWRK